MARRRDQTWRYALGWLVMASAVALPSCKDVSDFSLAPDESYCGYIVPGVFVRQGFPRPDVRMRMTFNADAIQTGPGSISTSDGRFQSAPMRPIPQLSHDALSTLQFGEGRKRNLMYGVEPQDGPTALAIVSLLDNGDVEVRVLRGAPFADATAVPAQSAEPLFAIFPLERQKGTCGF